MFHFTSFISIIIFPILFFILESSLFLINYLNFILLIILRFLNQLLNHMILINYHTFLIWYGVLLQHHEFKHFPLKIHQYVLIKKFNHIYQDDNLLNTFILYQVDFFNN